MGEADMDREPLEILAEEFAQRLRRGESPSVELYASAHPEIAGEIRRLFPTIAVMERLKARSERSSHGLASLGPIQLDRLGDFRIIREIGRGGMGIVFEAEQESLGRHVALKVLPRQALLEPQHLARFRREAQLASRLHHTNIVQVYGVGEQDGFHYYIMQFVRGVGLDQVIERLRDLQSPSAGGTPGAAGASDDLLQTVLRGLMDKGTSALILSAPEYLRWVARMGEQVAAALGYAHEQGTLHRDVKPSNLLLDDQGTVWVTDFGLARATHAPEVTQGGDLTGTLRYLAPERLSGQTDERGDIYGLGLTLYELLTLRPAYDETDRSALIRRVAQESPPLPRAVNPAIPRDLETVVVKAISREPAHRYATAAAVADDLRRFQEDRPVLARRIGPVGRLGRWCRRNKIVAALTASTLMLIVTVAVVALVGYVRARNALAREAEERRRAEAVAALAGEALDRVFARLGPSRVVVSELPVGGTGIQIVGQPAISQETASLLEEMLPFYDRLSSQTGNDATLQRRVADARRRLGDIRQRLGRFDKAIVAYRQSIEIYGTLAAQQPNDEALRVCMAEAYNEMGKTCILLRRGADAGAAHRQALELLHAVGATSPPSARFELARTHFYLGQRVAPEPGAQPARLGRGPPPRDGSSPRLVPGDSPERPPVSDPALDPDPNRRMRKQHLEQAAGLLTALNREQPKNPDYRYLLALCYRELLPPPGQDRDHVADRAVEILEQLAREYPQIAEYRFDLCETYAAAVEAVAPGQPVGAPAATEERLRKALVLSQQLTAQHPDTPEYQASQARIHHGLGEVFRQSRQLDAAEESDRRALEIQGLLAKRFPEVLTYQVWEAALCNSLADLLLQRAKLTELRRLADLNIARTSQLLEKHPDLWYLHALLMDANRTLALAWRTGGDVEQAARAEAEAERHRAFLGADARGPRSGPATHPTP